MRILLNIPLYFGLVLIGVILLPKHSFCQEKKIEKALNALKKSDFEECQNFIVEFKKDKPNSPLVDFVMYKLLSNSGYTYANLDSSYRYLEKTKKYFQTNVPNEDWCKKFEFCKETIDAQLDSLISQILKKIDENPSDLAYNSFFKNYSKSSKLGDAWRSFYDWKYKVAFETNSSVKLEEFIALYPKAHNLANAKTRIEELDYDECMLKNTILLYEQFIKKHANSIKIVDVKNALLDLEKENCKPYTDVNCLESFLKKYPQTKYTLEINQKIEQLEYDECMLKNTIVLYEQFIKKHANSTKIVDVKNALLDLEKDNCKPYTDINCLESFLKKYPESKYTLEINQKIEQLTFENAKKVANKEEYEKFLIKFPNSIYSEEIKKEIQELSSCIVLTCIGIGNTKESAKQDALQNAMNRVLSTFVSSNSQFIKTNILTEESYSASAGNIKSYNILNEIETSSGDFASIISVVISISNLQKFVESKGGTVEFKGNEFAQKIKMQQLIEKAEYDELYSLFGIVFEMMQTAFDYDVKTSDPLFETDSNDSWAINVKVIVTGNEKLDQCFKTLISCLEGISMSEEEVTSYEKINKPTYSIAFDMTKSLMKEGKWKPQYEKWNGSEDYFTERKIAKFYFRKIESLNILESFLGQYDFYLRNFEVSNNLDTKKHIGFTSNDIEFYKSDHVRYIHPGYADYQTFFSFPISRDTVTIFNYQDHYSIDELSKLTTYKVHSLGVSVKVKHGGYVVYEKNGKGMVLSIADYPISKSSFFKNPNPSTSSYHSYSDDEKIQFEHQYNKFLNSLSNLSFGGYSEWKLPTENQFRLINKNLVVNFSPNKKLISLQEGFDLNPSQIVIEDCYITTNGDNQYEDENAFNFFNQYNYRKDILKQGCGYLTSEYITNTFNCEGEHVGGGALYKVLFNYDSINQQYKTCSLLNNITYINNGFQFLDDQGSNSSIISQSINNFIDFMYDKDNLSIRLVRFFDDSLNIKYSNSASNANSVIIGNQTWMNKNLNVDKFRNGDIILEAKDKEAWIKAEKEQKPVWCYFDFDPTKGVLYGKLYNWYAVNDPRGLAPDGWKIPSCIDFRELTEEIGLNPEKLRSQKYWEINGTNSTGFSAYPSGDLNIQRQYSIFGDKGTNTIWWTSSPSSADSPFVVEMNMNRKGFMNVYEVYYPEKYGLSVRCIKIEE
jgi:uncharacterized protein (TIGR02145 family)